jgi:NlpE C-terminal OB domain
LPRSSGFLAAALLVAACAQSPDAPDEKAAPAPQALPPLPATFVNDPDCPGCLAVTVTLRSDGSYLLRDQLGASEFYDFGRWRYAGGTLELAGDRDTRSYPLASFRKSARVERLRGPFRLVGIYDGVTFKECRTGAAWRLAQTRAAETLKGELQKAQGAAVLVSLDAQFEGAPEVLRVLRPAAVLDARACPS